MYFILYYCYLYMYLIICILVIWCVCIYIKSKQVDYKFCNLIKNSIKYTKYTLYSMIMGAFRISKIILVGTFRFISVERKEEE